MISVVIATMNRAEALKNISLKSLLKQNCGFFEVIVWDASDGDESKLLCEQMSPLFSHKGFSLNYQSAPRKGSASQRNDAARFANGDIIFFIDDDCEVPADGLTSLSTCFESFEWLMGAGLPLINLTPASGNSSIKKFAARLFWLKNNCLQRIISRSGSLSLPIKDLPGMAEWLSGGSMAFKKEVFDRLELDERLQSFGGYALGEDVDFSHRVTLEFKRPLMVAQGSPIIHHAAEGKRITGANQAAAYFFNPALIRRNFARYSRKFGLLSVAWGELGTILTLFNAGCSLPDMIRGAAMALKEMKGEKREGSNSA
jgi:glycosyltransferase involved in cell wall biosynthesis